jgi:hypothetical protein
MTTSELLGTIDFIVDPLLVLMVEVRVEAQARVLLHHIRINTSNRQEFVLGKFINGLGRSCGGLLLGCGCCCSLTHGGARKEEIIFFNLALTERDGEVPLLGSTWL